MIPRQGLYALISVLTIMSVAAAHQGFASGRGGSGSADPGGQSRIGMGLEQHYLRYHPLYRFAANAQTQPDLSAVPAAALLTEQGGWTVIEPPSSWSAALKQSQKAVRSRPTSVRTGPDSAAPAARRAPAALTSSTSTQRQDVSHLLEYLEDQRDDREDDVPEGVWEKVSDKLRDQRDSEMIASNVPAQVEAGPTPASSPAGSGISMTPAEGTQGGAAGPPAESGAMPGPANQTSGQGASGASGRPRGQS